MWNFLTRRRLLVLLTTLWLAAVVTFIVTFITNKPERDRQALGKFEIWVLTNHLRVFGPRQLETRDHLYKDGHATESFNLSDQNLKTHGWIRAEYTCEPIPSVRVAPTNDHGEPISDFQPNFFYQHEGPVTDWQTVRTCAVWKDRQAH